MGADVKVLAIGAHPDDVEIGCGATLALLAQQGYDTGIVDLTRGEMGTNGTMSIRAREAQEAGKILRVKFRLNLGLPDSQLTVEPQAVLQLVELIRKHRPQYLLAPYWQDRHPDHATASLLVQEANFKAGLSRLITEHAAHRAQSIAYYFINDSIAPTITMDVSEVYNQKQLALAAHASQFSIGQGTKQTRLNNGFLYMIESRDRYLGSLTATQFGEGFVLKESIKVKDIVKFWEEQS